MSKIFHLSIISFSLFLSACGDDPVQSRFSSSSSNNKNKNQAICKSLKTKTCVQYARENNCTGAQQQQLCNKDLDADNDGFICDSLFVDKDNKPNCSSK